MDSGVVPISLPQLALATIFVLFVGVLSWRLSLGVGKPLLIGTIRTYVQLFAVGYILRYIFAANTWWLVIFILLVMTTFAASIILRRLPDTSLQTRAAAFFSMLTTTFVVTFTVTGVVIGVDPWYQPQYVIPLAGMVLGNSMTGISLAVERAFADMDSHSEKLRAMVALGATPWEAAHREICSALTAGLMPMLNSMSAVGIVSIPGMMSGQILAGADPVVATGYQIIVMLMLAAASGMGSVLAVMLSYKRRFTKDGIYLEKAYRNNHAAAAEKETPTPKTEGSDKR